MYFIQKTFVCFTSADCFIITLQHVKKKTFEPVLKIIPVICTGPIYFPIQKRRIPAWHPSLSILTSSPFASSGSVSLPQLIRKATPRRTSSRIQPFFLIYISISHCISVSMCEIEHLMHNGRLFSKALFLYIEGNVMINPLPVCLIQNFVAHSRIQLAFHVYITGAPHILHCFCKMTHVDHTGIIRATDKKHGHFPVWCSASALRRKHASSAQKVPDSHHL